MTLITEDQANKVWQQIVGPIELINKQVNGAFTDTVLGSNADIFIRQMNILIDKGLTKEQAIHVCTKANILGGVSDVTSSIVGAVMSDVMANTKKDSGASPVEVAKSKSHRLVNPKKKNK